MASATDDFFTRLRHREHEPILARVTGAIRFDLAGTRTEHWMVGVDHGSLTVSRGTGMADCVVHATASLFERIVSGQENTIAALLRGAVIAEGDLDLLVRFQRIFPGPSGDAPDPLRARAAGGVPAAADVPVPVDVPVNDQSEASGATGRNGQGEGHG